MHFYREGNKFKVRAYRGMNHSLLPGHSRPLMKYLGSIDAVTLEPSAKLLESMTPDEHQELAEWMKGYTHDRDRQHLLEAIARLPEQMREVAGALRDETFPLPDMSGYLEAMEELKKVLKARKAKESRTITSGPT